MKWSRIISGALLLAVMVAWASPKSEPEVNDVAVAVRLPEPLTHAYPMPELLPLVDTAANAIVDSAGSLAPLFDKLAALRSGGQGVVSVLHIGDSHVQAGFWTGRVMELMQADFGDAGRGLIVPHRLAGMNEARDYAITARYRTRARKATEKGSEAGATGVAVTFQTPYNEVKIWSKSAFDCVTALHAPAAPPLHEPDSLCIGSYCDLDNTPTATRIPLSRSVDSVTLSGLVGEGFDDPTFYGFVLENGRSGVLYHAAGLNGAAFEHFAANTTLARGGLSALAPDLVIISLGTNNCFGSNFRAQHFREVVDGFAGAVRSAYPDTPVLVTTPMEACRRAGRRRVPNPNVAEAAAMIREVAAEGGMACWDLYAAAGGEGAMGRWFAKNLANTDRIHLLEAGYTMQGDMLYDALARRFNEHIGR